jgi:ABC-type lipoprotein export system ATPase subunit
MLEKVGLGHRLDHRPYEMSGGEQQRTSIARALINDPQFLLADEPTGNLDSKTGREIFELMVGLRDSLGLTMVVATHDRSLAGTTDRIIYLDDGRVDTGALNSDG